MNLDNESFSSSQNGSDELDASSKKLKITYTREFLLSLSDLDVCKKLPSGFDESLLCELEDSIQSLQDRQRVPGNSQFQGFRRNEYGSSPPSWGDSANFSRGNYGKMGIRSSGQSDRDSDSQSDLDSDSGRRYSQPSRRSWHSSEQDGLLGSGSFPKPSGYTSGGSAPRMKTFDHHQLWKSNEPYHPPRPKAVPYSRRDTDAYNDETFGSTECSNENRAEEERRRRASFEQMRKEQHMNLQEKHISNLEKPKARDVFVQHEDKNEEITPFIQKDELQVPLAGPTLNNPSDKSSTASPAFRPLVPPGFRNNIPEKGSGLKSPMHHALSEEGQDLNEESIFVTAGLEHSMGKKLDAENQLSHGSSGALEEPEIFELNPDVLNDKTLSNTNKGASSSVLEKMFGSPLTSKNFNGSTLTKFQESKPEDERSPSSARSSKFAQWFSAEEAKSTDDLSSGKSADILSLLVNGDKSIYQVSDSETAEKSPYDLLLRTLEQSGKLVTRSSSEDNGIPEQAFVKSKENISPTILTCEDLENSILTEYSVQTMSSLPLPTAGNVEQPIAYVDGNASLHLLSLLQKGPDQNKDKSPVADVGIADKPLVSPDMVPVAHKNKEDGKSIVNSEKTLTLEMLFGSAFMKELQSVQAPVSVQRGLAGSAEVLGPGPHGMSFSLADTDSISSSVSDGFNFQRPSNDQILVDSNHQKQTRVGSAENALGFKPHAEEFSGYDGFEGGGMIRKDDMISATGPPPHGYHHSVPSHVSQGNAYFSARAPPPKLAASIKDEANITAGSEMMTSGYGRLESLEREHNFQNQQQQRPSPQFHHMGTAHVMPISPMESIHPGRRMDYLGGPEIAFNNDYSPANLLFQRPFHDRNAAAHHSTIFNRQMQMPGNYGSPHMVMPEMKPVGGAHKFPNHGYHGFPPPVGEMEMREGTMQKHHHHPFAASSGHGGDVVDMALRYR